MVYTMVEMAKANDLNTYKYLTYLLTQRPNEGMSDELLEQLTPWSEAAKASCQN
jgi:transposase